MDKSISQQLQELKAHLGWSETVLADAIGTSQPTVHRILGGQKDCIGSTYRAIEALYRKTFEPESTRRRRKQDQATPHCKNDN